jgi:phenylacetate-CoA ligase
MAKTEMFDPQEISIIQARQLRKTIHYIYQRSPYYYDLFDRERIQPTEIKTLNDLRILPTTSREDLQREGDRFLCVRPEEIADIMTTSGTGGIPCVVKVTESDISRLAYNEQLSAKTIGITEKDVVALAVSLDRGNMAGLASYFGLRRIGATVVRVGHLAPEQMFRFLTEVKPTCIVGMPSYLKTVAQAAEQMGEHVRHFNLKRLVCIDEPIREQNFSLNAVGMYLSRIWKCPLYSIYRSTELSTSLSECEAGFGSHVHPEISHIEIVDDQGNPMPEGQVGELCVTPFGVSGMPVLRYRTGDFTFIKTTACTCSRKTLRLGPILRQRSTRLTVRGQVLFPSDIHGIVQEEPDVRSHVLVLENEDNGGEKVTLLLDTGQARVGEQLTDRIHEHLGLRIESRVVSDTEIRSLQKVDEYSKPRLMVDRRQ